ncbi:MAG: alpha-hydroxy acid oxidase [bacterium]
MTMRVRNPTPSARIHSAHDAQRLARRRLPRMIYDFITGGTGRELAPRRNQSALARIRLQPRVLRDTRARELATRILGEEMGLPFGIAPMGLCNLAWPGADQMLAAAAARHNIPLCVSTASSTAIDALHQQSGGRAWFQLYTDDATESALRLAARAQDAGCTRLILTADVPQLARRTRDLRNGFRVPFRIGARQFADFALHPRWSLATLRHGVPRLMNFNHGDRGGDGFARNGGRGGATWDFLDALRAQWRGGLIVKGVMSPCDARRIRDAGADAVYVSNHGGRQLDSAPAAIDTLPAIRDAVGDDYPLLFDSGLRGGEDIVKALALGADFTLIGSPALYAIGADGARGLAALIAALADEISVVIAQLGLRRVTDIDRTVIASGDSNANDKESANENENAVPSSP